MNDVIIKHETETWAQRAEKQEVTSQVTYETASEIARDIIHFRKKIEAYFKPMIDKAKDVKRAADEARKAIVTKEESATAPIKEAEKILQRKIRKYEDDLRAEENRRKEIAEQKAKELAQKAEEAIFEGKEEEAQEIVEEAENQELISETVVGSMMSKTSGAGVRRDWSVEVTNITLLPAEFLLPDLVKLRAEARQMKENFSVPGCRAFVKDI